MLIEVQPVSPWQANCYLIAAAEPEDGSQAPCIIVDPGIMSFDVVSEVLQRRHWRPVAVLATHGHLDHVGDAHRLAAAWGIPVHCPAKDQPMLGKPSLGLGQSAIPLIEEFLGADALPVPTDLRPLDSALEVAGLSIRVFAAPGHTAGSTLLEVSDTEGSVVLTGDVLFAGTIGRTDLPSGSMSQMRETLARIATSFDGDVALLPGHGPATTLAQERASNPFMQSAP
ncbi:MAG: MBL fold metallo-hydrolase [Arachnia sp.]